jgi:hypothetical protein
LLSHDVGLGPREKVTVAFVALEVDIGDLDKAAELTTDKDTARDGNRLTRATVHPILMVASERRRRVSRVPAVRQRERHAWECTRDNDRECVSKDQRCQKGTKSKRIVVVTCATLT